MTDQVGLYAQADELIDEFRALGHPHLIVISGPSGVGKDTVIERLRERHPEFFVAVTKTTRERRPGEIDGYHYLFATREEFIQAREEGDFLESAEVYGNLYGVPKSPVQKALRRGQTVVVKVDVQGARHIKLLAPEAVFIFLVPPSMEELTRRLRTRKTDDPEMVMRRIATASRELRAVEMFDYVVFNESGRVEQTLDTVDAIICAESHRVHQRSAGL
ncbi:MAG TPA: guanylate kinase [Thermomicrobiaceae bacterium]|nr:guanylate kinase [Thermomicrobiaceae bacterium]